VDLGIFFFSLNFLNDPFSSIDQSREKKVLTLFDGEISSKPVMKLWELGDLICILDMNGFESLSVTILLFLD